MQMWNVSLLEDRDSLLSSSEWNREGRGGRGRGEHRCVIQICVRLT